MSSEAVRYFPATLGEAKSVSKPDANREIASVDPAPSEINSTDAGDEVLLARASEGDRDAFTAMFRRYARVVRGVGLRILQDSGEADDLVQEVFLFLHRKCNIFDRSKSSARSWILQIANHRAIDRRRRLESRNFYIQVEIDEDVLKLPNPGGGEAPYDHSLEAALGREQSRRLFDSLSQDQREVIRLAFYEGHTFEEIARMRGQSFGNVRNHYYRGLEKLRKQVFCAKLQGK